MMNKLLSCAGALALSLTVGVSMAHAAKKPVTEMTCEEYLALDETERPNFIYYAAGYNAAGQGSAVLDVNSIDTIQPELDAFCKDNAKEKLWDRFKADVDDDKDRVKSGFDKIKDEIKKKL